MKKTVLSILACFAIIQYSHAATPPLTESLLEYEAIIDFIGDPMFDVIPVTEFITDIKRKTKQVDILGEVKYLITTRIISELSGSPSLEKDLENYELGCHCGHRRHQTNTYLATLTVAPNPGVGPNIVTVDSITKVQSSWQSFFDHSIEIETTN